MSNNDPRVPDTHHHSQADSKWDEAWLVELDRRVLAAEQSHHTGSDWASARQRILAQLPRL